MNDVDLFDIENYEIFYHSCELKKYIDAGHVYKSTIERKDDKIIHTYEYYDTSESGFSHTLKVINTYSNFGATFNLKLPTNYQEAK